MTYANSKMLHGQATKMPKLDRYPQRLISSQLACSSTGKFVLHVAMSDHCSYSFLSTKHLWL